MPANLKNSEVATGLEKVSFHSNHKERQYQRMFKLLHNCTHLTLVKQCSKFSKPGFRSTWTVNFQMFKLDLEKAKEPEIKLPTSIGSLIKQKSSRKTSTSALLTMLSLWLCGSQQTVENSERDGNIRPSYLPPEKSVCRSRNKLELDMEQQTGSKSGKEYIKAVHYHPAYLTYMESTSWEMLVWKITNWNQGCQERYQ